MKLTEKDSARQYVEHLLDAGSKETINYELDDEMELPPWYDEKLCKKAQKYYNKYLMAAMTGMLCGLISVLAIPSILKVLIGTQQSGTIPMSYRRYVRTIHHVMMWHEYELKPNTKTWKSLQMVRSAHLKSSKIGKKSNFGEITQKDLALTQFGFVGYITYSAKLLGIHDTSDYLESTIHFWRVIGHLIGIKDEYNLCAETWAKTKVRLEIVINEIYQPSLINGDENFNRMATVLLNGLWYLNPLLSVQPYLFYTKRITGCDGYQYFESDFTNPNEYLAKKDKLLYRKLSFVKRCELLLLNVIHQFLYSKTIFRIYFNLRARFNVFINYYFPILSIFRFGINWAYVRVFRNGDNYHED